MSEGLSFDLATDYPGFALRAAADLPGHGITALVGPSGAGKTTLLQAIAGLEPARGHVTLNNRALHPLPPHKRGVGVVFQNARLFGHLDVAGNIGFGAARRGAPRATVARIVDALDLGPLMGRAVTRLSGGETRRVALARTLAAAPDLLLLDEPLSGLDPDSRADILPYLARAIRASGCPTLFVTHDRDDALQLADRQLRIANGRADTVSDGPPCLALRRSAGNAQALVLGRNVLDFGSAVGAHEIWGLVLDPARIALCAGPVRTFGATAAPVEIVRGETDHVDLRIDGQVLRWPVSVPELTPEDDCFLLIKKPLFRLISDGVDSLYRPKSADQ